MYNLSFMNSTNVVGLLTGINNASNNVFSLFLFISIYFVVLISFSQHNFVTIMLSTSFIMSVIAGLLLGLGLIPAWLLIINIVLLISTIFYKIWAQGG